MRGREKIIRDEVRRQRPYLMGEGRPATRQMTHGLYFPLPSPKGVRERQLQIGKEN